MNRFAPTILCAVLMASPFLPLTAQDDQAKPAAKPGKHSKKIKSDCNGYNLAGLSNIEIDLSGLEVSMQSLRSSLSKLQSIDLPGLSLDMPPLAFDAPSLPAFDLPEVDIPPLHIDMPSFAFEIPPLPSSDFLEFALRDLPLDCNASSSTFEYLSDEDELRLSALRALSRQGVDQAIAAYRQLLQQKAGPALRYEAIRLLECYLDDARVLPLLEEAARNDRNVHVRKKAIELLGKSRDSRAIRALESIVRG